MKYTYVCFAISFFFFIFLAKVLLLSFYPDFSIYYEASKSFAHGMNPYLGGKQFFTAFVYPPFVLVFFLPFILLPFFVAEKLWITVSLILFLLSLGLIYRMNKVKLFSVESLFLSSLAFIAFPAKFTLGMGQSNMVILFLVTLFLYFFEKKKQTRAAVVLGLSIAIKLFPVLFLAYLFIKKQWKILFLSSGTIFILFSITYVLNPEINNYFYQHIFSTLFSSEKTDYYNQALSGFLLRTIPNHTAVIILKNTITAMILLATFFVIIKKQKADPLFIFSLLITTSVIVNNFSWQHHFVWLIIPFLLTYFFIKNHTFYPTNYVTLFISFILTMSNIKNPSHVPILIQSHVFYGGLLLWVLQCKLLLKKTV